jgi:hypothetical protein
MNCFAVKKEKGDEVFAAFFKNFGSKETSNLFHCFSLIDYYQLLSLYASYSVLVNARTKLNLGLIEKKIYNQGLGKSMVFLVMSLMFLKVILVYLKSLFHLNVFK